MHFSKIGFPETDQSWVAVPSSRYYQVNTVPAVKVDIRDIYVKKVTRRTSMFVDLCSRRGNNKRSGYVIDSAHILRDGKNDAVG